MDRLRAFFNNVYSCKQITLSLCAPIPLQELEIMARKYFSAIAPRNPPQLLHNTKLEDPYRVGQFHKLVVIAPVEEIHLVKLCWLIPPQQRHYKKKPADYVAWLLTHECKGSVYAWLKSQGYICSMDAYCSTDFTAFSQFYCTAELTEKGMENVQEVIHTIFQYIAMIQRHGASRDIFDQLSQISDHCFKYKEPEEPCDLVESMVEQMNYYEDEDCLSGGCVFEEFDAELIEEVQKMLTPTDVNITLLSKKYKQECDQIEEWFKSKFTVKEIPAEWIDPVACSTKNDALHLPEKNRYISDTFTLYPADPSFGETPTLVKDTSKAKMWYKPDRKFLLPKADINFMLITPVCHESNFHLMCADVLDYILDFELEELCCEASITELHVSQNSGGKCHCLSINGFNDKLFLLFKDVVDLMASFRFSETAFNVSKEQLERDHRNALIKSEELNGTLKHLILRNVALNPIQSLNELATLTPERLGEFYKRYFSHMFIESLFQGNITKGEAEEYLEYLCTAFQYQDLPPEQFPEVQTLGLPLGRTVCRHNVFNKKDPNSVIHNYYEVGAPTLRLFNVCSLLQHVMEEPLFNTLRTKQQLGYTVYCSCEYSAGGILAYSVTVETDSDKFTADEIDNRIESFLRTFYSTIEEEKDYDKYVESYIKLLKQADLSVSDEAARNWSEIYYQDYIFDRRYRSIEMVKQIDKSELLAFMKKYLLDEGNVRMLSVQVIGATEEEEEQEEEEEDEGAEELEGDEGYEDGYEYEDEEEADEGEGENEENEEEEEEEDEYYDDDESDEDVENLQDCTIDLLDVPVGEQYTRSITDIDAFRDAHTFHPFTRLLLE